MDEELAVIEAGYKPETKDQALYKLRNHKRVQERIAMLKGEESPNKVASRADREAFWTQMMCDPKNSANVRLEASKLLGKAHGDFLDRSKVETEVKSNSVVVLPGYTPEQYKEYWEENN
jgi:hypothetical protein